MPSSSERGSPGSFVSPHIFSLPGSVTLDWIRPILRTVSYNSRRLFPAESLALTIRHRYPPSAHQLRTRPRSSCQSFALTILIATPSSGPPVTPQTSSLVSEPRSHDPHLRRRYFSRSHRPLSLIRCCSASLTTVQTSPFLSPYPPLFS